MFKISFPALPGTWPLVVRSLLFLSLSAGLLESPAFAQARPRLNLLPQSGLSISGTQGATFAIETTTNLAASWQLLTLVKITNNPTLVPGTLPAGEACRFYRAAPAVGAAMVFIAPGSFLFGSPSNEVDRFSNEGPQTSVTITKGFFMA